MKRPITPTYTFNPGAGTLNLSGISGFNVANLFAVINLRTGGLVYSPLAGFMASAVSGTTLTLTASLSSMLATDPLMVIYDDGGKPAEDGTDATAAIMPAGGAGIRGWLSGLFVQALALVTSLGAQGDAAATADTGAFSLIALLKRMLGNDTTALTAINAASTREGALPSALPDAFGTGASGKLGALGFIWQYAKAAAASAANAATSLLTLIGLLSARSATGTLGALTASVPVTGGPYGAVGYKLVGTSVQTISALGTRDGATYDVPLGIVTEVASPGVSTSGQTLAISGTGPFFGYVEAAGCIGVQLVTSAYTSGSLAATLTATPTSRSTRIRAPQSDPAWVATVPAGLGALLQVPAAATAGAPLTNAGAAPTGTRAALLIIPPGGELDVVIAAAQPTGAPFSVPYPNTSPFTLEVLIELNGMLAFVTMNTSGTVNSAPAPCGFRWI